MITLPQGNEPGSWEPVAEIGRARFKAFVRCPKCNRVYTLRQHTVADDGTVTPSLVCPHDDCDFHEYVKLEGWADQ